VSGGKIGDMALHYINKYNMMAVRLTSKWDIRRLAKTTGATALPRVTAPTAEEFGLADQELNFYWNLLSGRLCYYRQCCGSDPVY
jgi:chaperonin GroEL (HSP60 family)